MPFGVTASTRNHPENLEYGGKRTRFSDSKVNSGNAENTAVARSD